MFFSINSEFYNDMFISDLNFIIFMILRGLFFIFIMDPLYLWTGHVSHPEIVTCLHVSCTRSCIIFVCHAYLFNTSCLLLHTPFSTMCHILVPHVLCHLDVKTHCINTHTCIAILFSLTSNFKVRCLSAK